MSKIIKSEKQLEEEGEIITPKKKDEKEMLPYNLPPQKTFDIISPKESSGDPESKSPPESFILDLKTLLGGNLFEDPKEEVKDTESVGSDKERRNSIKDYVKAVHNYLPSHKKSIDFGGEGKTKGSTNPSKSFEESKKAKI